MADQRRLEGEQRITPAADIYETDDDVVLMVDLPGVSKDGLSLSVSEDELVIKGAVSKGVSRDEEILYGEMAYADYYRAFALSDAIDRERVTAKLEDGVLTVTLAKVERVRPREIAISFE